MAEQRWADGRKWKGSIFYFHVLIPRCEFELNDEMYAMYKNFIAHSSICQRNSPHLRMPQFWIKSKLDKFLRLLKIVPNGDAKLYYLPMLQFLRPIFSINIRKI